jgi:beta-glucosidase
MQRNFYFRGPKHVWYSLTILIVTLSIASASQLQAKASSLIANRPWMDTALTPDQRADSLIAQMTLDEKIALVHGVAGPYIGYIPANTHLGIPSVNLEDGPAGVADDQGQVTAFPAPIAGAAS